MSKIGTIRVCLIAYDFPPLNSGGAHRPLRFCRYLPEHGVEVTVFSVAEYDLGVNLDQGLLEKLPPQQKVFRSRMRPPRFDESASLGSYLRVVDSYGARWQESLKKQLAEVWAREPFDAVVATAPPFSVLGLGVWASRTFNVPLVADMRDSWSMWCFAPFPSYLHYILTRALEGYWLGQANAILVPTHQVGVDFVSQHPGLAGKIHFVPNGFEEDISDELTEVSVGPQERYVIGYAGSFYYNPYTQGLLSSPWYKKKPYQYLQYVPRFEDWTYRSPYYFLKTLARLFQLWPDYRDRIRFRIAGSQPEAIREMIAQFNLQEQTELIGFLPKSEMANFYQECDFALATSVKVPGGRDYCIAGKTYECYQNSLPILGFVCDGAQRENLSESGFARIFDPDQTDESAEQLHRLFSEGQGFMPNKNYLKHFDPGSTSAELAGILKMLVEVK